jgi:hypothetical protein
MLTMRPWPGNLGIAELGNEVSGAIVLGIGAIWDFMTNLTKSTRLIRGTLACGGTYARDDKSADVWSRTGRELRQL